MIFSKINRKLLRFPPYRWLVRPLYKFSIPGFAGVPIAEVLKFLITGLQKSSLTNRAAAVSFKFFMALFPGLIFLISLIPYIPARNFSDNLLSFFQEAIPEQIYPLFSDMLNDILKQRQSGVLSLGFLLAFFFSTNGMNGLMKAFNDSAFMTETRKGIKQRGVAIMLTFLVAVFLFAATVVAVLHKKVILLMFEADYIGPGMRDFLLRFKWMLVYVLFYFVISAIFYLAPAKKMRWPFFSPGAVVSTLFSLLFTFLISVYIRNFNNFNQVYGLLGSFPIILIWIFLNSLALLIGFELNISIRSASGAKKEKRLQK